MNRPRSDAYGEAPKQTSYTNLFSSLMNNNLQTTSQNTYTLPTTQQQNTYTLPTTQQQSTYSIPTTQQQSTYTLPTSQQQQQQNTYSTTQQTDQFDVALKNELEKCLVNYNVKIYMKNELTSIFGSYVVAINLCITTESKFINIYVKQANAPLSFQNVSHLIVCADKIKRTYKHMKSYNIIISITDNTKLDQYTCELINDNKIFIISESTLQLMFEKLVSTICTILNNTSEKMDT
jgi:hypothetical protein